MSLPVFSAAGTIAGSATWPTVSWPGGQAAGDFALMFVAWRGNFTTNVPNTPSGWTFVAAITDGINPGFHTAVFYRFATSNAEPSVTLTSSANPNVGLACIATWTGVNTGTPIHSVNPGNTPASTSVWLPGGTSVLANCLAVGFSGHGIASNAGPYVSTVTNSDLASLATRIDGGTTLGTGMGMYVVEGALALPSTILQTALTLSASSGSANGSALIFLQSSANALPTSRMNSRIVNTGM